MQGYTNENGSTGIDNLTCWFIYSIIYKESIHFCADTLHLFTISGRHSYLGPWSRCSVLLQLLNFGIKVFCIVFKIASTETVGLRARSLCSTGQQLSVRRK